MFSKSKVSQSMIDAVNSVIGEKTEEKIVKNVLLDEATEKVPTPTGMKVYGSNYGNSMKARKDQTSHEIDKLKSPKNPHRRYVSLDYNHSVHEEGDCVTEPEAKNIAKKEVKGHEKKMHHKEEMTFAEKLINSLQEKKDVVMPEDAPATSTPKKNQDVADKSYLKDKPGVKSDLKNLGRFLTGKKETNEEVELNEDNLGDIAKKHGMQLNRTTYGAGMKHPTHGEVSVNRYGEWHHKGKTGDSTDKFASLDKHLSSLKEEVELDEAKVTTPDDSSNTVTTDTLKGREPGGKSNNLKPFKLKLKTDGEMKAPKSEKPEHTSARASIHAEEVDSLTEEELDSMLNEVLSKDATAGDWIHDFVHSDNPKFAGKSKAERKKMALGAYYGKQNEETESGSWHKETPWKVSKGTVTDKSGAKHTPMSRAKDLARQSFKKLKNEMLGKAPGNN